MGLYSFLFSLSNVLIKGCNVADVMEDPKYSARNLSINHKARAVFLCCYPASALIYNTMMCVASWLLCFVAMAFAIAILFPFVPTETEATVFTTYTIDQFEKWNDEEVCIIENRILQPIVLAQQSWVPAEYFDAGGDIFNAAFRRAGEVGGLYEQFIAARDEASRRLIDNVQRTVNDESAFWSNCSFVCTFTSFLVLDANLRGLNESSANYNVSSCISRCQSPNFESNVRNGPPLLEEEINYDALFAEVVCFSNKKVARGSREVANDRFFAFMNFFGLIRTFGAWIILGFLMPFAVFSRFMNHIIARRKTKKDELQLDSFKNDPDTTIIDYVPPNQSDDGDIEA